MNQDNRGSFKVVLVFDLEPGMADEELRRSAEEGSFPSRLATQPGFVGMELVKIDDGRTMSIQTWETDQHWRAALGAAKETVTPRPERPNIVRSREAFMGSIAAVRP